MYCSDCHGSNTAPGIVVPDAGKPWGPHGSSNNFLLKGTWTQASGGAGDNALCFRCHAVDQYANPNTAPAAILRSGFSCATDCTTPAPDAFNNLHIQHASRMASTAQPMRCTQCHEAVSHGWKNKALLVNLNDLGLETGNAPPISHIPAVTSGYSQAPYYMGAWLSIASTGFAKSGEWKKADCDGCH